MREAKDSIAARAARLGSGAERSRPEADGRTTVWVVLAIAIAAAGAAYWIWSLGGEQRAIRKLSPSERAALYERTLADVKSVCANSDASLDEYCRTEGRVLLSLPECDAACRELALRQLGSARRER